MVGNWEGKTMAGTLDQLQPWENGNGLEVSRSSQLIPLHHPICTRTPLWNSVYSAWIGHVPFAMCVVYMVRPRVLVELGTYWGVSYCAFCQAVKELRLPTECYAVDTWQGDPHAGFYTDEVINCLKAHHDERYSLFSTLLRSTFDEAIPRFVNGTVDLLHIDGNHTYEAVKHDFESWLPKMSDRGVVLFHDIDVRDRETFGVWRYWDELKQKYPHFAFYHSYGLGVLAVGENIPSGVRPLFALNLSEEAAVQQFFANLGDHATELNDIAMQRENLRELLDAKIEEGIRLEAEALAVERARLEAEAVAVERARLEAEAVAVERARLEAEAVEVERARLEAALEFERRRHDRLRYRAVDKAFRMARRVPFLSRLIQSVAMAVVPPIQRFRHKVRS